VERILHGICPDTGRGAIHFPGQLGIQSIPAVFAFVNGQPVDGFLGALPEGQVTAFIERVTKDRIGGEEKEASELEATERLLGVAVALKRERSVEWRIKGSGLKDRKTMEPLAPFNGTSPAMQALGKFFREEGLYTFVRWNTFFANPPLCITEAELKEAFAIIDRGLEITDKATV